MSKTKTSSSSQVKILAQVRIGVASSATGTATDTRVVEGIILEDNVYANFPGTAAGYVSNYTHAVNYAAASSTTSAVYIVLDMWVSAASFTSLNQFYPGKRSIYGVVRGLR